MWSTDKHIMLLIFVLCFSGQIKSSLIKELADKNWKVRGEALQKVWVWLLCVGVGISRRVLSITVDCD